MSIDIYYYSGTGNSLFVAREFQKRIPEANLIPIMRLLRRGAIKTSANTVGFVFPNFCLTIPIPVHEFLHQADLASAGYIFAICTRGGSQTEAFEYMDEILEVQGKALNARLDINMPWNHCFGKENLPGTNSAERIAHLEVQMQSLLDDFCRSIIAREPYLRKDAGDYELSAGMKLFDLLVPKSLNYKSHEYMYRNLVRFGPTRNVMVAASVPKSVSTRRLSSWIKNRAGKRTCHATHALPALIIARARQFKFNRGSRSARILK